MREEENENYQPDNTLRAIGLTEAGGKGSLGNNEIDIHVQRSELNHSRFRNLLLILWGCALELWLYVIAAQVLYPRSMDWPLATWLPIRLDFVGETAFISSFFLVTPLIFWVATRTIHASSQKPTRVYRTPAQT